MSIRNQLENRYNASDWEIDPDSWLWRPSTKLALLGNGYGTTKARSSGPGAVTGTLSGVTWRHSPDIRRNYFSMTGGSDYIKIADSAPFAVSDCTFAAWVYPLTASSTTQCLMQVTGTDSSFAVGFYSGGISSALSSGVFASGEYSTINQWVHIAAHAGSDVFTNGVRITSGTNLFPQSGTNWVYGARGNYAYNFNGYMADIVLCKGKLPIPQIRQLASRRPDMGGLIRSRHQMYYPAATTETPPAVTYRPMQFMVC